MNVLFMALLIATACGYVNNYFRFIFGGVFHLVFREVGYKRFPDFPQAFHPFRVGYVPGRGFYVGEEV